MADRMEKLGCGSLIQHGPDNSRIYLMKLSASAPLSLPMDLMALARRRGYEKIFAKVPAGRADGFLSAGYECEARVPGFFGGRADGLFLAFYLNRARAFETAAPKLDSILDLALTRAGQGQSRAPDKRFRIRACREEDAKAMAAVYKTVFPSYPFPIHDSDYLLSTMRTHVSYFCVEEKGAGLVALSSAETDMDAGNCEMTDFATLPGRLGNGFGAQLLAHMEDAVRPRGFATAYTIARALSVGMNITFARCCYSFAGRLKNNTNISGGIESMNVWYKAL